MKRKNVLNVLALFAALSGLAACSEKNNDNPPTETLTLSLEKSITLTVGEEHQLSLKITPATDYQVNWGSVDASVATVSETGLLKAVAKGETEVTATVNGHTAVCEVTVKASETSQPETSIRIALADYPDAESVARAIKNADGKGITEYILSGDFSKLGIETVKDAEGYVTDVKNPFLGTKAEVIDMSGVNGWPQVESGDLKTLPGLPPYAFNGKNGLKRVVLPDEVKAIGSYAFISCISLESITGEGLVSIGENAFTECHSLSALSMPKVESVGDFAFINCEALETVVFPKLQTAGNAAFFGCYRLRSAEMPKVSFIGQRIFQGCDALAELKLNASAEVLPNTFEGLDTANCTLWLDQAPESGNKWKDKDWKKIETYPKE